ncbi:Rieske (2Fe-2S) protein [Halobaculum gomorrense]|uniref:Ferredoxin subunit of nitrite reductase or a ring-hydroxylating dioxygenase n=1 Tax=Halobaculum gomorrense TaxID=43928 RepID=A0A1M5MBE6_9EURY|nr:Rieske (2Fe-2S) protein [Halobaculum gomorrense]SHG74598.1 Ferredoxin subunit of nitrite reductase or a ring-hydroxylating dioxygenase [Halobaculum gomorrense]
MAVDDTAEGFTEAVDLADLREEGRTLTAVDGTPIALFYHEGEVRAVNNRCPHMGFPLTEGSVEEGVLTCHWHHARFELSCGDTFDPWADDVDTYPTEVRDGVVYVSPEPQRAEPPEIHWRDRLDDGLEQNLRLVLAKSAVALLDSGVDPAEIVERGVTFGVRNRADGWSSGLTILTALANRLPDLDEQDRKRALYQGLTEVAGDCDGEAPKFDQEAFAATDVSVERLRSWFRENVEVRDADGAERVLRTAVAAGYDPEKLTELLVAAATDHRYLDTGHAFDYVNKATEALDLVGWDDEERTAEVLSSLVRGLATADRAEETASWRQPDDLAAMCAETFGRLDDLVAAGEGETWTEPDDFTERLHAADPEMVFDALEGAIRSGATVEQLASAVSFAAAKRVALFATSNEFADWNTVHHTFTFANAVHRAAERTDATALYRGVFDAAVNVYLDRFLNTPPAPEATGDPDADPEAALESLRMAFEQQGRVQQAGDAVADFLAAGGDPDRLKAELGNALLVEDTNFHTFQAYEAACRQFDRRAADAGSAGSGEGVTDDQRDCLVAAARYMAANYPTRRSREQTFSIAARLLRGERVDAAEDAEPSDAGVSADD